MVEIENFGFMLAEDKAKLDSINTDTLLTKVEADKIYLTVENSDTVTVGSAAKDGEGNVISETYVKKDDFKNCIVDYKLDEKGVTLLNGEGQAVLILPVVAPKV